MACVRLYVYECALLERWVYFLCYVSCISLFLPIKGHKSSNKSSDGYLRGDTFIYLVTLQNIQYRGISPQISTLMELVGDTLPTTIQGQMSPLYVFWLKYLPGFRGMIPPRSPLMEMEGRAHYFQEEHSSPNKSYPMKTTGERVARLPRIQGEKSYNIWAQNLLEWGWGTMPTRIQEHTRSYGSILKRGWDHSNLESQDLGTQVLEEILYQKLEVGGTRIPKIQRHMDYSKSTQPITELRDTNHLTSHQMDI